jgi:hypothetical protein
VLAFSEKERFAAASTMRLKIGRGWNPDDGAYARAGSGAVTSARER